MVEVVRGGDSATPKPQFYPGHDVWGVYVAGDAFHVWTTEEVRGLSPHVKGVLPIVVPPQNEKWWAVNGGYAVLEQLVRDALDWGVPVGSPLCLDVEYAQAEEIGTFAGDVLHGWAVACVAHELRPWVYSTKDFLAFDMWGMRWLAEWPEPRPTDPQLPRDYAGWQFANEGEYDESIFEANRIYMTPELGVVNLLPAPTLAGDQGTPADASTALAGAAGVGPDTTTTPAETGSEPSTPEDATPDPTQVSEPVATQPANDSPLVSLPPEVAGAFKTLVDWLNTALGTPAQQ